MEELSPEVLERLRSGETAAFRAVVDRYQDLLFDLAMRLTRNSQDAEDLVQEAFVRMFRHIASYDPNRSFGTWAYTITLNLVRNHLRRKSLLRFLSLDFAPAEGEPMEFPDASPEPARGLEQAQFAADFEAAIAALPLALQEVFVLFYIHDQSVRTISEALGASENAVKLKLMRARDRLRRRLQGNA